MATYNAIPVITKALNEGIPLPYQTRLERFLIEKAGASHESWQGRLSAKEQRALFGQFLGKGLIYISGSCGRIEHWRKVCFGLDSEMTARLYFKNL
jgi:hypothetical protein